MAKYRLLTSEELMEFEKEFVDYLIVNGITAEDWEEMKYVNPNKAQQITDLFSDVVFEKIFRSIQFLVLISPSNIQAVQCLPDKMIAVGLTAKNLNVDLTEIDLNDLNPRDFELYKAEKDYQSQREVEIFKMTQKGFSPSQGELFKRLILATV